MQHYRDRMARPENRSTPTTGAETQREGGDPGAVDRLEGGAAGALEGLQPGAALEPEPPAKPQIRWGEWIMRDLVHVKLWPDSR